jgi:2-oxoisovalerate dehydrogenase E1 component
MSELIVQNLPCTCHLLEVSPEDLSNTPKETLVLMLFLLFLVREFETAVLDLSDLGLVHGPVHTSIGQEAVAAGMALALRKSDMVGSTHRAHGHFIAKAFTHHAREDYDPLRDPVTPSMQEAVNRTLAEIMGLSDGWCKGRGGSMHLYDGESGNLGSNGIVGGGIPLVTGAAWGEKLMNKDTVAVSFFGDGAINQGCFHETANMAALWGVPVIYFVENNMYAVGTSTSESSYVKDLALRSLSYGIGSIAVDGMDPLAVYSAFNRAVEEVTQRNFPFFIEGRTYRHFHHSGRLPGSAYGYRSKEEEASWLARDPIVIFPSTLLQEKIIREEDDVLLRKKAKACVEEAVNFCTEERNGTRFVPMEKWPRAEELTRDVRCENELSPDIRFSEPEDFNQFKKVTYVEAVAAVMARAMERDERVIVMGEEVANLRGGAYQACKGIKDVFPERLFNTPISECGFVGMAGGASSVGLRPVVEIMFPDFALMAGDQLFNQIGKLRHMYGGRVSFPMVIRTRIGIGFGYGGQHSMNPAGLFALHSGWRIVAPSNAFDYVGLFNTAVRLNDPVLIIEHGKLYGDNFDIPADTLDYSIPYGKARVLRGGSELTVLTYLTGVKDCQQAAEELGQAGRSIEIIDLRTVDYIGMDYETIGRSVMKTGSVLIVEQAPRSLGISARLSDEIQERFYDYLDCPVSRVAAPDVPPPVSKVLEDAMWPSVSDIKEKMVMGCRHNF